MPFDQSELLSAIPQSRRQLDRVGNVLEADFDTKFLSQVIPESHDAEAFGGVVASRDEVRVGFASDIHDPLAGLAGDKGVELVCDGVMKGAFRRPTDDSNGGDVLGPLEKPQRLLLEGRSASIEEFRDGDRRLELALETDAEAGMLSERSKSGESKALSCDGIVSNFGMSIERQMIGEEIQSSLDELSHTTTLEASQDPGRTLPEDAVMNEDCVGMPLAGPLKELLAG